MSNRIQELTENLKKMKKEFSDNGKKIFQEEIQSIFDKYPDLQAFSWTQYTPYFCDGDECIFGVNAYDIPIMLTDEDECINPDDREDNDTSTERADEISTEIEKILNGMNEEIMKSIFGDHVEVVINRDGTISTDEYEHD